MRVARHALISMLWVGLCAPGAAYDTADTVVEIEASADAFADGEPSKPSEQGWLRIAPRVTRQLSSRLLLTAAPVLEADSHGDIGRDRLYDDRDRDLRRAPLRFERLSLRFDLGPVKVEIGKQPLTWGRTDAVQATDNLTPRDWTDPLREARLSPWAVRFNFERSRWEGELALVPRYAPSRLPRVGGRWAPVEPIRVANPLFPAAGPPELEVDLEVAAGEFPSTTLDNLQTGVRFGRRGGRAEWAVSYYRGFDDAPRLEPFVGELDPATATVSILLRPRFAELEVVGADAVLLAGAWALRAEAGHFRFPEGLDDDFLLYEVDLEWTRGARRVVIGYVDRSGAERASGLGASSTGIVSGIAAATPVALDLGFVPAAFVSLGRSLLTEWEASVEAFIGTEDGDSLLRLSGSLPTGKGLRLGAEIDLVDGKAGSFFGAWRDNDRLRVFTKVTY